MSHSTSVTLTDSQNKKYEYEFLPEKLITQPVSNRKSKVKLNVVLLSVLLVLSIGLLKLSITEVYLFLFPTEKTENIPSSPCSFGYTLSKITNFCYKPASVLKDLQTASDECENDDGELISVTDYEKETGFVMVLSNGTVCKKPSVGEYKGAKKRRSLAKCTTGYTWFKVTQHCYNSSPIPVNFEKAQQQCAADAAELVSIHSDAESDFVIDLYRNSLADYRRTIDIHLHRADLWLGLVFNKTENEWMWTDGSDVDHTMWAEPEPNLMDRAQHWAKVVQDKLPGYSPDGDNWNNVGKNGVNAVVCKKPGRTTTTTTATPATTRKTTTSKAPGKCDPGYKWFNTTKHCYKCALEVTDFENARNQCLTEGGDLASIHSFDENHFIAKLYYEAWIPYQPAANATKTRIDLWIGLHFHQSHQAWKWTDGSEMNMMRWAPAEPNNLNSEFWGEMRPSLYVSMDSPGSYWNNLVKDRKRGFVCKKRGLDSLIGAAAKATTL